MTQEKSSAGGYPSLGPVIGPLPAPPAGNSYPSRDEIWAHYAANPRPVFANFELHVRPDGTGEVEVGDMVVFEADGLPTDSPNAAWGALSWAFATRLRAVLMDEP